MCLHRRSLSDPPAPNYARDILIAFVTLLMFAGLLLNSGCAQVKYKATKTVEFVLFTGESSPTEGCRINVFVDGKERFVLAENPAVDCVVTDVRVPQ
jgi:hypothetical protein